MCESELEAKYRNLAQGQTVLESSLHKNLAEHINAEIGIGTISDIRTARQWLRGSFLRKRIQRNPGFYHIGKNSNQTWEERMDDMVSQSVKALKETELVSCDGDETEERTTVRLTEFGEVMSKVRALAYLRPVNGLFPRSTMFDKRR
jgi:ATP-dependent DNA helicase HFM1/MER3